MTSDRPESNKVRSDNSPVVTDREGVEVDLDEWDPMPSELRTLDGIDEADLSEPMDGPAPSG